VLSGVFFQPEDLYGSSNAGIFYYRTSRRFSLFIKYLAISASN